VKSSGTIVMNIVVDAAGNVSSATVQSNNTGSQSLAASARKAALSSKFSAGTTAEKGTITYKFTQK